MAFDVKQHLTDHITELADKLKQLKQQRSKHVVDFDEQIAAVQEELDAFQSLLANAETKRPAAKKAATAKKG